VNDFPWLTVAGLIPLVGAVVVAFVPKDRVMLPRRAGVQHTSRMHAIASFSNAEWEGEEKARYLTELTKDVDEATREVQRLGP
jgi:NADH:ubiquinone oxidoreductase subunit 4 (subunit M)